MARVAGLDSNIFGAVLRRNEIQQELLVQKILQYFNGNISGKKFAVWGLAFKPDTDDVRCASSLKVIRGIYREGAQIVAYDPQAENRAAKELADLKVEYAENQYKAIGMDSHSIVKKVLSFDNSDIIPLHNFKKNN